MFFNVMLSFLKTKDKLVMTLIKLFSDVILHGLSNEPEGVHTSIFTINLISCQGEFTSVF